MSPSAALHNVRTRLEPSDPADRRPILFIGDIQGCAEELALLLAQEHFDPAKHRLIPVGDTINRGPDAPGVLKLLREYRAEPILGNHELHLLDLADSGHQPSAEDKPGSAARQFWAVGQWPSALEWIRQWPNARSGPGWVAVHAGVHPRLSVEDTPPGYLAYVRYCTPEGDRPTEADGNVDEPPPGYAPWYTRYRGEAIVIYGHWARQGLHIEGRVRGLDSGCVYGGQLTGLWWPEDRLVQVASRQPPRPLQQRVAGKH